MCLEIIYLIYMYKKDLSLNNQQWLIYHKTKPNQSGLLWPGIVEPVRVQSMDQIEIFNHFLYLKPFNCEQT